MIFIIFIIGLFIGSFLNVIIDRLPRNETFLTGRSHCDFCKHVLSWYDLVPVFSFLLLHGKCRYCHSFFGWKYPLIEITTASTFALTYFFFGTSSTFFILDMLGIMSCLLVIFYTDFFQSVIPDKILVVLIVFSFFSIYLSSQNIITALLSALGAVVFFLGIFFLTKGKGMGFGDVKYSLVMGLLLNFPGILIGLYVAFLTGAASALILVIARKKRFHQTIPFGPFLVIGTVVTLFWEKSLWIFLQKILGL